MDFRTITNITTPVGNLVRIRRKTDNKIIWEKNTGIEVAAKLVSSGSYLPMYWGLPESLGFVRGKTYTLEFKNKELDIYTVYYRYFTEGSFLKLQYADSSRTYDESDEKTGMPLTYVSGELTDLGIVEDRKLPVRKLHLKDMVYTFTYKPASSGAMIYSWMGTLYTNRIDARSAIYPYVKDHLDEYTVIIKEV